MTQLIKELIKQDPVIKDVGDIIPSHEGYVFVIITDNGNKYTIRVNKYDE